MDERIYQQRVIALLERIARASRGIEKLLLALPAATARLEPTADGPRRARALIRVKETAKLAAPPCLDTKAVRRHTDGPQSPSPNPRHSPDRAGCR
jgi:hypothetical protein